MSLVVLVMPVVSRGQEFGTPGLAPRSVADREWPEPERTLASVVESVSPPREVAEDLAVDIPPRSLMRFLGREEARVQVYGWIQNSFTGNTNGTPANRLNYSVFPNRRANDWQGNQYYLIVEDVLEATDEIQFGFRFDTLFGNDWEFTKDFGLFDNAFQPNSFLGVDFPQMYGEVHLPILTEGGLDIRGGRWYSPAGFEGDPAVARNNLSAPNSLNFTPFTFFGVLNTLHVREGLDLYGGTVNGWDRWINRNYVWNALVGSNWKSSSQKIHLNHTLGVGPNQLPFFLRDDATFVPAGFPGPPFMAGKRNPGYTTRTRYWNSLTLSIDWTERLTQAFQSELVVDEKTPGFGPDGRPVTTSWYGFVHWFLYDIHPKLRGMLRTEIFRDNNGAVLGQADNYYAVTLGLRYIPRPWLWIRPEARYDWAQYKTPYNDGTRGSQLTLAFDIIVLF